MKPKREEEEQINFCKWFLFQVVRFSQGIYAFIEAVWSRHEQADCPYQKEYNA